MATQEYVVPTDSSAKLKAHIEQGLRTQIDADGSLVDFVRHGVVLWYSNWEEDRTNCRGVAWVRGPQVNYLSVNLKNYFVGDLPGTLARFRRAIPELEDYWAGMKELYVELLATLVVEIVFSKGPDGEDS